MTKAIPAGCSFGDVSGQETDYSLFMVEEELAEQLEFREQIVEGLTAMTRALVMVAIDILRMWLSFGKYRYTQTVKITYRTPDVFGGITST